MPRDTYRQSLESWIEEARAKANTQRDPNHNHKPALGVKQVIETGFDARPKRAAYAKRPYVFAIGEQRREHVHAMMRILAEHRDCSERFRAGERMVFFPEGTYPPPLLQAA